MRNDGPRGPAGDAGARHAILRRLTAGSAEAPLPAIYRRDRTGTPEAHGPERTLTARFVERATEAGAEVRLIAVPDVPGTVVDVVTAAGGRAVITWQDPLVEPAAQALRRAGIAVHGDEAAASDAAAAAAFGLTTAEYAIAETGTLVLAAGPGRSRGASLLPGHHIAILPEDRIHTDLFALMSALHDPLPSALTFITGPSRTADIGLTPVRPAHGPMAVTILVIPATPA